MVDDGVVTACEADAIQRVRVLRALQILLTVFALRRFIPQSNPDMSDDDVMRFFELQRPAAQADTHPWSIATINGDERFPDLDLVLKHNCPRHTKLHDAGSLLHHRPAEGTFPRFFQIIVQPDYLDDFSTFTASCKSTETGGVIKRELMLSSGGHLADEEKSNGMAKHACLTKLARQSLCLLASTLTMSGD